MTHTPSPREPNAVDRHVGMRLRLRRQLMKISQEELANSAGITFQQVQKYERGANRVGAGRLYRFAQVLEAPVTYFFEGLPESAETTAPAGTEVQELISSPDGVALASAFARIQDPKVRKRMLELARTLAEES